MFGMSQISSAREFICQKSYVRRLTGVANLQFTMQHDEWLIKENIAQLRQLMSDQNLQLLPDYEQRISVLKDLGFIDENSRVELKGKVACEVIKVLLSRVSASQVNEYPDTHRR